MMHDSVSPELLKQISPTDVRAYAKARGWQRIDSNGGPFAIFQRPGCELDQLLVPNHASLDDYINRMREVILKLAEVEKRKEPQIVNDIFRQDADTLRFRVVSSATERGTMPLISGLNLLEGAKRSILAAACSVINPQTSHPRLSRTEADQLIQACELGQTERGSFVVAISCPLRAVERAEPLYEEPFSRQVTELLFRSVQRIVREIEHDRPLAALEEQHSEPTVSANLCDALLRMRPEDNESSLVFGVSWAPSRPIAGRSAFEQIELQPDYFPLIDDLYTRLQPKRETPSADLFIGQVDELRGELNEYNQRQGEIVLALFTEDSIQARVNLTPEQYAIADRVHMSGGFIAIRGLLKRGQRISHLTDLTRFEEVKAP